MRARITEPLRADNINATMEANERGVMFASSIVDVIATGAGAIAVGHDLNETPADFVVSRVDNVDVYSTAAQRATWNETVCELTASGAGSFRVWFVRGAA